MIELEGVSKRYGGDGLAPLTMAFPSGSVTALIGPSGAGKSTLIRILAGLVKPDSGVVRFDGTVLADDNVLELRRKMGYVIQDGGLFPHLTARGNATLMARHLGRPDRLDELVELTRFPPDALDRYPAQLSGGQRQRVSLMRALMLDPEVLLLDEPLGALDPMIRSELQADLSDIFARLQKTVVLVTHDLAEAVRLAQSLVLLRAGRVVQRGTIADLRERPAAPFVTRFVQAQRGLE